MTPRFVLASASPARRLLLENAGLTAEVMPSDIDESAISAPTVATLVEALAEAKARTVATHLLTGAHDPGHALVLGCDSLFELDGVGYGKPDGPGDSRRRWARMSGRAGFLRTGHCLVEIRGGEVVRESVATSATWVSFGRPDAEEVAAYVASGEPLLVAGSFTIDGLGGWFIERVEGDHGTVVGLSLPLLRRMLRDHGVRVTDLWPAPQR